MCMLKLKAQYLSFVLIANALCSCSFFNLGHSSPQAQLADFIEDSPSVYLSKPKASQSLSRSNQQRIVQQLATNDKKQRDMPLAQQGVDHITSSNKSNLPQIKSPSPTLAGATGMQPITPEFTASGPQLNTGWGNAVDFSGNISSPPDANGASPILNLADMRHPKTPGLNTSYEEEASVESNKDPRPNQPELRGYRSPQIKKAIPLPYESN